ncbi:glycosyltransferase family 4 protein [Vagococcus silagei]|uniref:Glycosyltransferase n=1 Tax=Vagococcus silagei TaxID=2508885 RepID=A0A4S3B081_9ENTE|nr:glycosyltransferase [Vagococcus silagei]THB60162.1 glycosyltransferase [Vagococcus silagei]
MKKVKLIGAYRGFFQDLLSQNYSNFEFFVNKKKKFEVANVHKEKISRFLNKSIFDFLGFFTTMKVSTEENKEFDIFVTYNRFIKNSIRPYYIVLENPTALINYSGTRMNSRITKKRLKKYFFDDNLLGVICISDACFKGFSNYYSPEIYDENKIKQLYPLIKNDMSLIETTYDNLECLFISSNFTLKGGRDLLQVFDNLKNKGFNNIKLTVITKLSSLGEDLNKGLDSNPNIKLRDFSFSRDELYTIYREHHVFLNPTRMDSFSLVTLEAIKHGLLVISTDIYAIPEMVLNHENGYLVSPKFEVWNKDFTLNLNVKNYPKQTYESDYVDSSIVSFIEEKLIYLLKNTDLLTYYRQKSKNISQNCRFSSECIKKEWEKLME